MSEDFSDRHCPYRRSEIIRARTMRLGTLTSVLALEGCDERKSVVDHRRGKIEIVAVVHCKGDSDGLI